MIPLSTASATGPAAKQLSKDAKGVFVPMTPDRLASIDADRRILHLSRGGALAAIYDAFRTEALERTQEHAAVAGAAAEDTSDLADAVNALGRAWDERAKQRAAIGNHSNQIAKLANVYRLRLAAGEEVTDDQVETLSLALAGVARALEKQAAIESADDRLRAEVRAALADLRRAP